MNIEVCPCRGCTTDTGRSQTCHSICEKYREWKSKMDERNIIKKDYMDKEAIFLRRKKRRK